MTEVQWWELHDLDWAVEMILLDADAAWCGTCGSSLTTAGTCPVCDHYTKPRNSEGHR